MTQRFFHARRSFRPAGTAILGGSLAALLSACGPGSTTGFNAGNPPDVIQPVVAPPPPPPTQQGAPSAGPGVSVYPTQLAMPGLDRTRGLRIYVPPGYATSGKRYPVIYMPDAQNLFDDATAQAGEWRVDESLDELAKEGAVEAIVVGIDRAGEIGRLGQDPLRAIELQPFSDGGPSEAKQYLNFVVNVVKPLIDKEYRTLPDRGNTAIGGASLGGLISYYAINEHPDVFGRAMMLSASFPGPYAGIAYQFAHKVPAKDSRLYFLVGGAEHPIMIEATKGVHARQLQKGHQPRDIALEVFPGGEHGEKMYRDSFKAAAKWLFAKPVAVDPLPPTPASTAGPGVHVYPARLAMPGLNRTRGLRIYTPPGYATSGKRYPVIYMQDGQNLFDDATAEAGKGGEWGVDETMDELAKAGELEAIVVGIDRAGELGRLREDMTREREFIPFKLKTTLFEYESEAKQYTDFVVNVVKPLIDKEYRTISDRANTAIMGAELGGMISYWIASQHPDKFSKVGLLSPQIDAGSVDAGQFYFFKRPQSDTRIYFASSAFEPNEGNPLTKNLIDELAKQGHETKSLFWYGAVPGPEREPMWRSQIKPALQYLFNQKEPVVAKP